MTGEGRSLAEFVDEHGIGPGWHFIYGLYDPRTEELRYIGKSDRPAGRLANQLNEHANTHRCHWIQELRALALTPVQVILDACPPGSDWQAIERRYIAAARADGHRLTNGTDGGDGVVGLSPEARERIRSTWLGRKHSAETRARLSAAQLRRTPASRATRERMSAAHRGRVFTADWRKRISESLNKLTPQQVREIRTALAAGDKQRDIAARFGIHQGSVSNIARGITYREVP